MDGGTRAPLSGRGGAHILELFSKKWGGAACCRSLTRTEIQGAVCTRFLARLSSKCAKQ
ncbi:hypothetical protein LIA77_07573 [Sarocladium implicatum]|nr:hypothetical protein LIA77_07573 [Sarocladium implicatum]